LVADVDKELADAQPLLVIALHELFHEAFDLGRLLLISEPEVVCIEEIRTLLVNNFGFGAPEKLSVHEVVKEDS